MGNGFSGRYLRRYWFSLGLAAIFLGAIALRFWGLDRINQLVFDEIYYVKYAVRYLTQESVFDAHPPFAKYLIALGIWVGENWLFRGAEIRNSFAGMDLSPLSYRWFNAVVGSLIPLLLAGVALQLTGRRLLALLAGLLAAADGFFLVESRLALLHVHLVAFGLLGQWCFLRALRAGERGDRHQWLLNAGLSFGACASVKWNGLGYSLVPVMLWLVGGSWQGLRRLYSSRLNSSLRMQPLQTQPQRTQPQQQLKTAFFPSLPQLKLWPGILCLIILPAGFYSLLWQPHLRWNTEVDLATVHQQILGFHRGMDAEAGTAHPYCSPWWTWPLVLRPMFYFFRKSPDQEWRYAIQALGNPVLWWVATLAMLLLLYALVMTAWRRWLWHLAGGGGDRFEALAGQSPLLLNQRDRTVALYLIGNYCANWLPWILVKRCTFIYHHLGAQCFGILAVAFWCARWLQLEAERDFARRYWHEWRWGAIAIIFLILVAFILWLPLYLALPLSEVGFRFRIWLPTWI